MYSNEDLWDVKALYTIWNDHKKKCRKSGSGNSPKLTIYMQLKQQLPGTGGKINLRVASPVQTYCKIGYELKKIRIKWRNGYNGYGLI